MKREKVRSIKAWAMGSLRWIGMAQLHIYSNRKEAERIARYYDPPNEVFQVEIREIKKNGK